MGDRLQILYHVVHTAADHEILKSNHDFHIIWGKAGTKPGWAQERPKPANLSFEPFAGKPDLMVTGAVEMFKESAHQDVPVIYRSIMDFGSPRIPKEAVDRSSAVVFSFKETAIRHAMDGHPKTVVIEPGIDTGFFSGWRGDGKPVLSVAHFASRPFKGGYLLAKVHERIPVSLCGVWNDKHPCNAGGSKDWNDLLERYRSFRVYFNPCPSFTLSSMEAMAVGMPLVTMATANFLDALQDGFNCLLAWDEGHAVEQIERLLSDRRMAERIGRNARETIVKRTSTEICQNAWDKLFRLMASGTMSQDQTRASGAP